MPSPLKGIEKGPELLPRPSKVYGTTRCPYNKHHATTPDEAREFRQNFGAMERELDETPRSAAVCQATVVQPSYAAWNAKEMRRMRLALMMRMWLGWRFSYVTEVNDKRLTGGAINRMMKRSLSRAFEQWQAWYEDMMRQKSIVQGALNKMRNRKMSMAWNQWQAWFEEIKRQRDVLEKSALRFRNRLLPMAYNRWIECHQEA